MSTIGPTTSDGHNNNNVMKGVDKATPVPNGRALLMTKIDLFMSMMLQTFTLMAGESVKFVCGHPITTAALDFFPNSTLSWHLNGLPLVMDPSRTVYYKGNMEVTNVHPSDTGVYDCYVQSHQGNLTENITTGVFSLQVTSETPTVIVLAEETMVLDCHSQVLGKLFSAATRHWKHNGSYVTSPASTVATNKTDDVVRRVKKSMKGAWECEVTDSSSDRTWKTAWYLVVVDDEVSTPARWYKVLSAHVGVVIAVLVAFVGVACALFVFSAFKERQTQNAAEKVFMEEKNGWKKLLGDQMEAGTIDVNSVNMAIKKEDEESVEGSDSSGSDDGGSGSSGSSGSSDSDDDDDVDKVAGDGKNVAVVSDIADGGVGVGGVFGDAVGDGHNIENVEDVPNTREEDADEYFDEAIGEDMNMISNTEVESVDDVTYTEVGGEENTVVDMEGPVGSGDFVDVSLSDNDMNNSFTVTTHNRSRYTTRYNRNSDGNRGNGLHDVSIETISSKRGTLNRSSGRRDDSKTYPCNNNNLSSNSSGQFGSKDKNEVLSVIQKQSLTSHRNNSNDDSERRVSKLTPNGAMKWLRKHSRDKTSLPREVAPLAHFESKRKNKDIIQYDYKIVKRVDIPKGTKQGKSDIPKGTKQGKSSKTAVGSKGKTKEVKKAMTTTARGAQNTGTSNSNNPYDAVVKSQQHSPDLNRGIISVLSKHDRSNTPGRVDTGGVHRAYWDTDSSEDIDKTKSYYCHDDDYSGYEMRSSTDPYSKLPQWGTSLEGARTATRTCTLEIDDDDDEDDDDDIGDDQFEDRDGQLACGRLDDDGRRAPFSYRDRSIHENHECIQHTGRNRGWRHSQTEGQGRGLIRKWLRGDIRYTSSVKSENNRKVRSNVYYQRI